MGTVVLAWKKPPSSALSRQPWPVLWLRIILCQGTRKQKLSFGVQSRSGWFLLTIEMKWEIQLFYLVEECAACSEPLYTGRQPPWSWWRDSFWSTRWVLVFLQFWEPKKSWFMAIHGTYFMFFWLQGNKFKTDLNWTSILTKCKHDSCSQISGFIPQSLFFMERMSQVVAVLGEISAVGTPRTSKAPMHQWSTKTRICYWIGLRVGIWVVHGWTRTMEHEDF